MPVNSRVQAPGMSALRKIIGEETARRCVQEWGADLEAVVLTGSLARNEATFVQEDNHWHLLGDADFFLVYTERGSLPSNPRLRAVAGEVERGLAAAGIRGEVGLVAVHASYLRNLRPRIATYELRNCGEVVWGDPQILRLIPALPSAAISQEDAWRMLCNRMIEFLEDVPESSSAPVKVGSEFHYATLKLLLDAATSYLVFAGSYEPTFRDRAERLLGLANERRTSAADPFPLKEFSERVSQATEWKLSGRAEERDLRPEFGDDAVSYARRLWRWELEQLTGAAPGLENASLWRRWANQQTAQERARGWLSVARRCGWHRCWRNWLRWAPLSLHATPRYWIYRVVGELLWCLPCRVEHVGVPREQNASWEELRSFLPELAPRPSAHEQLWRELAREVSWNYRKFLLGTDT